MSVVVEYVMRLKDMISGPLQNVNRAARSVNETIRGTDTETARMPGRIQQLTNHLGRLQEKQAAAFSERNISRYNVLIRDTRRELQRLNDLPPEGFLTRMRQGTAEANSMGGSIRNLVGVAMGLAGLKSIITSGASLEQSKISFEVLLGNAEKAKAMLGGLNQFANATPYENAGLIDNAKLLLSFGANAQKIIPTLRMLGDVAMGDQQKLNSMTLAFAQMSSVGKLQGQDLLQMINAGFNPLQALVKMTGKSLGQLRGEMEKGKISAQMVEQAFQYATSNGGQFFGMMDKMSQSTSGKYSTVIGSLKSIGAEIGEKLLPYVNILLEKGSLIGGWVSQNMDMALQWAGTIGVALIAYKSIIFATGVWTTYQAILNGTMALNPIGLIITGIAVLVAGIIYCYNKFETFRGVIDGVWGTLKTFAGFLKDGVVTVVKGLCETFSGLGDIIKGVFTLDWDAVGAGAKKAMGGIKRTASGTLDAIPLSSMVRNGKALGEAAAKGYGEGVENARKKKAEGKTATDFFSGGQPAAAPVPTYDPSKSVSNITQGGARPTNITINLNREMIGQVTIMPASVQEGVADIGDILREEMLKILNSANAITAG